MDPNAASALSSKFVADYSESGQSQLSSKVINFIYTTPTHKLHFKDVVQKFSNIKFNDDDDPSEVWRSLKKFYYAVLEPEIERVDAYAKLLKMEFPELFKKLLMVKVKLILEFPALGMTNFEGFVLLYHQKETKSHGSNNRLSKLCLNNRVLKHIVYQELPNEFFTEKVAMLIERIGSEFSKMDHSTLGRYSVDLHPLLNIFNEKLPKTVLNEDSLGIYFSIMIIEPVVNVLNIIVGNNLNISTVTKKAEVLNVLTCHNEGEKAKILKLKSDKFYTYPDYTVVIENFNTKSKESICNIEMKLYNCINIFTKRKGKVFDQIMLQLLSQIIAGHFALSLLTDGYNVILIKLNLNSEDLEKYISNPKGSGHIPFRFKQLNISGAQGIPNAKKALSAMLFEEIELSKMESYQKLKQTRIELLKNKCLKKTTELIKVFKNWNNKYYEESVTFESHKIAYEPKNYKNVQIYNTGPEKVPQMLLLSKTVAQKMFNIKIDGNLDKKMLLKIYDPARFQIQNYVPELHESEILDTKRDFESMYTRENKAYEMIKIFNHRSNLKINTPERYSTREMKLEITELSYYVGKFILSEYIPGRPARRSHYRKGIEQLQLLKEAKIEPDYIKPSNIYYENGKFYISDLCHSTLGDIASHSSNYELNLHAIELMEKDACS